MQSPAVDLAAIEARGTVRDVGAIAERLCDPEPRVDAVRALESVLSRARPRDLVWLEANARDVFASYRFYGSTWDRLDPSDVHRLAAPVQRLATLHRNGRVREAAVRALAASGDAGDVPYLLFRANDWVIQVSDAACDTLEQRLASADAAACIAILPFEPHVRSLRRRALGHLFDRARHALAQPAACAALREAVASGPPETRRACADLAALLPSRERASILRVALRDRDPKVASLAARGLLEAVSDAELREIAGMLRVHSVAKVRGLALIALAARAPSEAIDALSEGLFDPARSVREVAQFELRRRCGREPLAAYVAMLPHARGPKRLATIAGVAECGAREDAKRVATFVLDPSARVRFEALRALARLDGDAYTPAFLAALDDPSRRVARVGAEALQKRAYLVGRARLEALVTAGGRSARVALQLLPEIDYWAALLASLRAVADPELRDLAVRLIGRLQGRQTYSVPSDPVALERAFLAVRDAIPNAYWVETLLSLTRAR